MHEEKKDGLCYGFGLPQFVENPGFVGLASNPVFLEKNSSQED